MKLILKCSLVAIILGITSFVIIQVPSVQDRIMSLVVSGMFNASDTLPKEDALVLLFVVRDLLYPVQEELKLVC